MTHETEVYIKKGNLDDSNQELWKCDICGWNIFGNRERHMERHVKE